MVPPLVLDIDGTLTAPDAPDRLDPRAFEVLPGWEAPVVLATGKAFPYPVALAHFLGLPKRVVAENGGVVCTGDSVTFTGDRDRADAVVEAFRARGGDLGWGDLDLTNRWRETEVAVRLDADEELLRAVAAEHDMAVVDTGYAYHVKAPGIEKGTGVEVIAAALDRDPAEFVAVGDSVNDASTFEVVGRSFAVANADADARAAADVLLDREHMDGTLDALETLRAEG